MKRNSKAVFKTFNDAFVSELAANGIKPTGPLDYHPQTPVFHIETKYGVYTCHHASNVDPNNPRPLNFCSVFGRFLEPDRAKKRVDCNPFNGKWNFDGNGYITTVTEARELAKYIVTRILSI